MKLIHSNFKKGIVKVKVDNVDDLWYLSGIIEPRDLVKGRTLRKIKKSKSETAEAVKKPVYLKIEVKKVEFAAETGILRVNGIIIEGSSEDIQLKAHHSFNIAVNTAITIIKERWLKFQTEKLKEACSERGSNILICVFDREEAYFALMKKYGYEVLSHISGEVQKKDVDTKIRVGFYGSIIKQLKEYNGRYKLSHIVVASPAFWKEELMKEIDDELREKVVLATCSSVGDNGIQEVMKRPEVKHALKMERAAVELKLVEELLVEISKNNLAAYGIKEVENAAEAGAVRHLLVSDMQIKKSREEGYYGRIDKIMKTVDNAKGEITIISHEHEGGRKLDGLGGIGALLRYKISF